MTGAAASAGEVLWTPPPQRVRDATLTRYLRWLADTRGHDLGGHAELWQWSVEDLEGFWSSIWEFFDVRSAEPPGVVLADSTMPGARWFPGVRLNWAEHALRHEAGDQVALLAIREDDEPRDTSWSELRRQVAAFAATLRASGVQPGDRVAAYLPNIPEAVVALLGSAAVGAVWAACATEFGVPAATARLGQVEPTVLVLADGYAYGGRLVDRRAEAASIRRAMPSVRHTIWVPYAFPDDAPPAGLHARPWTELDDGGPDPDVVRVPFDHPLWVLYSSGTTGRPKGLVQGHGGILLEHLKWLGLYTDLRPGDRFFFHTSTAWMVWNALVSGLLTGTSLVLYDGSPAYPDLSALWRVAERTKARVMGTGAGYLTACRKAGVEPGRDLGLRSLETLVATGSPLPLTDWNWVYEHVSGDVRLDAASGGTDVCTPFVGGAEILPVHAAEIETRMAGVRLESWSSDGQPQVGQVGELVVTEPMPSMPLHFWDDPDGTRYRDSYFDVWPGVWRHGDWVTLTERGTVVISGRSDATLNRAGVRMGSSDIYDAVEALPEIRECLVVGAEMPDGGYYLPLFVVPADSVRMDEPLRSRIVAAIRDQVSPRHVPDEVVAAPGVPHTLTGKRLEVPVKRLLQGVQLHEAVNLGSVDAPEVLRWYAEFAAARQARSR
ncbi:MAG: acetoacetate--CoA ligase [Actinomycetes bacterium]